MRVKSLLFGAMVVVMGVALGMFGASDSVEAGKKKAPVWTIEWDLQAFDAKGMPTVCKGDEEICKVQYALILRRGSLRVGSVFNGKVDMKSFIISSWGPCKGKNKKRGLLCGMMNHDCGDGCYADVVAVKVKKKTLIIDKYEGCRGGEECTEKPKQVFSRGLGNVKIKVRK